jgi:hypothetical protein
MTTSIPLSALPIGDDVRRDRWGRYLVVPPGGGEPVGYTRATTVAKALDDGGGLAPWKATMAVCGTIMRRGLRARWEALMAETNGDPWYFGEDAKRACKDLVEECAEAGGSAERRDTGTALHKITALTDAGHIPMHLTDETQQDLTGYHKALAVAGIEFLPEYIERTVILDDWKVGGMPDRIGRVPGFERPLIADLKCGASLDYSWRGFATQLAIYSRADCIYQQGPAPDGSEDERLPVPDVDQDNGLIIWLNAGTGDCELFLVDLGAGWHAFELSMQARAWRATNHVHMPLSAGGFRRTADKDLLPALEASVAVESGDPGGVTRPPSETGVAALIDDYQQSSDGPDETGSPSGVTAADTYLGQLRDWLQDRIDEIGTHQTARDDLLRMWPSGIPSLMTPGHSPDQLEAILKVVNAVERLHGMPFPADLPTVTQCAVDQVLKVFPNTTPIT